MTEEMNKKQKNEEEIKKAKTIFNPEYLHFVADRVDMKKDYETLKTMFQKINEISKGQPKYLIQSVLIDYQIQLFEPCLECSEGACKNDIKNIVNFQDKNTIKLPLNMEYVFTTPACCGYNYMLKLLSEKELEQFKKNATDFADMFDATNPIAYHILMETLMILYNRNEAAKTK